MALQFNVRSNTYLVLRDAQVIRLDHELPDTSAYVSPITRFVPFNRSPRVEIPDLATLLAQGPEDLEEHLVPKDRVADGNDRVYPVMVMNSSVCPFTRPDMSCREATSVIKGWEGHRPDDVRNFVEALPGHTVACAHVMAMSAPRADGVNAVLRYMGMCDGDEIVRAFNALD